ncbi:MAG: ferrous iron transport protein B, partial [Propionibacteriaceae bacterium]|nr:ferrous iron transport protein B [Propionibacteriaceae bacterium]
GTYSLTAYSVEEEVARDFITDTKPDVVVHVVDSSNLERNLYLAVQLIELGAPLVLAFNMSDVARARGQVFDIPQLSRLFGAPIVETIGHRNKGTAQLLNAVIDVAKGRTEHDERIHVSYGLEIEEELLKIQRLIESEAPLGGKYDARWLAVKLLENDVEMRDRVTSPNITTQV